MGFDHRSVLLPSVLELLDVRPGRRYLDGTLGGGGHSEAILLAGGSVVGIDRDPAALAHAGSRLARFGDAFTAVRGSFGSARQLVGGRFHGLLLDLGVSSPQLDTPERGFSLQHDGPVDMRMGPDQPETAAQLIDRLDEDELVRILHDYGEEPRARRIARAVLAGRPWTSTLALADCVSRASGYHGSRVHPATRTFQALRIAVNQELEQLERALDALGDLLEPSGRAVIISFHSLEDRLVKQRFRAMAGIGTPRDAYGNPATPPVGRLLTRHGLSGLDHDPDNPRARSARVRALMLTPPP